jgi:hypothetical protein
MAVLYAGGLGACSRARRAARRDRRRRPPRCAPACGQGLQGGVGERDGEGGAAGERSR